MCFKANWIFFILFSMKSHKASNLVARKQVPFCSYFLVLSLHALFLWISLLRWLWSRKRQCQVGSWLPAGCLCSPMASEGLFLPCNQGLEVSGTPNSLPPWGQVSMEGMVGAAGGSVGHGCPGPAEQTELSGWGSSFICDQLFLLTSQHWL